MEQAMKVLPTTVMVDLLKYENRAGDFKPFRKLKVQGDRVNQVAESFTIERIPVKGFYKYSWIDLEGNRGELYCVSPSVFEEIEIT